MTEFDNAPFEFEGFGKIPRLRRNAIITEKIDGTNAQVLIRPLGETLSNALDEIADNSRVVLGSAVDMAGWIRVGDAAMITAYVKAEYNGVPDKWFAMLAGSRKRWIVPGQDNAGFALWVSQNAEELVRLGEGRHFGEWWGKGIQRGYGLAEKRFSLFNAGRWTDETSPTCTSVVPVLADEVFTTDLVEDCLDKLRNEGSVAAPGFDRPEGVIVYHVAAGTYSKVLLENDEIPKTVAEQQK